MVEAATEFRKNSFNDSDSATLAKVATMFTNVADESMSAADSASFIIAQMKAFNIEADDAYRIIDSVNAVSNNYAVSSGQLAQNLGNMSAAMATGNNTFEQSLGMLTAMTEITRNAAKGSRALITVQGRLNQVVDESSDTGKALTAWYQKHAIAIKDDEGQVRSLYEVLTDVAKIWPKLTKNEQMYYLQQQAGTTQTQNLAALLRNYKTAIDATNTALESNGSAMKENEAYMESISAKEQALAAEFEDFANRVLSKELVGGFLDAGKAMLDFANNDVGAAITRITGFSATIASLVGIAGTVIGKLSEMRTLFSATNAAGGLASILTSPKTLLIIAGVAAAIAGIVEVVQALNQAAENRKFENLVKNFEELDKQAKDAADKLADVKKRLDELNDTPAKDRGQDWQNEIDKLETLKQYYEYIEQMRQGQAAAAQEAAYNAPRTVGVSVSKQEIEQSGEWAGYERSVSAGQYKTEQEAVYALAAKENISFTNEQTEALSKLSDETEIAAQGYAYLKQNLEAIGYTFSNNIQTASEYALSQGSAMKGLAVQIEETKKYSTELTQAQQEQYDAYIKNNQGQYEYLSGLSTLTTEQQAFVDGYKAMVEAMGDYSVNVDNVANEVENISNSFASYNEIVTNYQDAMNGVTGASEAFVQSLFDQNGQLTTTAQTALTTNSAMAGYANTVIQAQQAQSQANFNNLIQQLALVGQQAAITAGQIANMMAMAGVSIGGASTSSVSSNLARTYKDVTGKTAQSNEAAYKAWVQDYVFQKGQENYKKQQEEYAKQLEAIKDYVPSGGGGGGGSSKKSAEEKAAEEAEKQAKKAQQAQEKAAKQSQQAYESAASSAEQAARQAAQAAEQAAEEAKRKILDSIQELKDASDDFWDSKTDAIEETNKELDRQKQLEEKLKALEEAKQKKILLYKNGQFQYDKDYGTIAKAQADYEETRDKIQRERELEQLEEMKDNATEIFNEMKDIVQNGGNVTQEMINNWLKNMAASGADYYDSNKKLLGEWLDWAKNALQTYGQGVVDAVNGYVSTSSLMSSGTYGSNAQGMVATDTNGARYLADRNSDNPLYWDKDGNFVGFTKAFWIDVFDAQIKKGQFGDYTKTDAWLGNMPGTSVFDNWKEVFEYWAKQPDADIYALQDMVDRFDAAKQVFNYYEDIFKSLGYDEYAKMAEQYKDVDTDEYWTMARKMMVAANPTDPSGERKHIEAWRGTRTEDSAELYQVAMDLLYDFMGLNKTDADTWKNQFTDTALGEFFDTAKREYHINRGDESDRYKYATFDTEALKKALDENEEALKLLSEKWFEAATDLDRQVIAAEAESRRKFRDLGYAQLGIDTTAQSEAERMANRQPSGKTLDEARRDKKLANNVDAINKTLEKVDNGQAISQGYITQAKDYIAKKIEENSERWFTLYDQTEKDKLHQQTEELRALQEKLQKANDLAEINNLLVHGEGLLPNEKADFEDEDWKDRKKYDDWVREATSEDAEIEALRRQMELNSNRWATESEEMQDQLHKENEIISEKLEKLGVKLTYSGETGKWSKNANGTRNFRGGLSLVGERGPEMRILGQGDNIIPANQTANLWKWSNTTPQQMLTTLSSRSGGGNTSYAFDVSRIELPNVTDAKSFVQGLKNYALQYSYKR